MRYEVIYNSDLLIADNTVLATTCVFYDKVHLPYTDEESRACFIELGVDSHGSPTGIHACGIDLAEAGFAFTAETGDELTGSKEVDEWEESVKVLFDNSVLHRLAPREEGPYTTQDIEAVPLPALALAIGSARTPVRTFMHEGETTRAQKCIYLRQDHVLHFARSDVDMPGVYVRRVAKHSPRDIEGHSSGKNLQVPSTKP
jgi:hypothetical protein